MDFSIREEQQEVRDLARRILEDLVTNDRLKQVEASDEGIDRRAWEALAGANLLGVAIPAEHGGRGLGFPALCGPLRGGGGDPPPPRGPPAPPRREGATWRLDGRKILVPAAHVAARIVVPATTG